MSSELMTLSVHRDDDGRARLVVAGECDASNARELRMAMMRLLDEGAQHLHIDFTATTYMDSHGVLVLTEAVQRLGPGRLTATVGEPLDRLLRITRLDEVLDIRTAREPAEHDDAGEPRGGGWLRR